MILSGYIQDSKGNIIQDLQVTTGNLLTGQLYYPFETWRAGIYEIDVTGAKVDDALIVKKQGYVTLYVSFDQLYSEPNPVLYTEQEMGAGGSAGKWLPVILGAGVAAAVIYYSDRPAMGKVTKEDAQTGLLIAGGIFGVVALTKLFQGLGIFKDKETKTLENLSTDPNNAWNPNYWKTKPVNLQYTRPITESEALYFAEIIYDGCNVWNDDEAAVKNVFRRMPSKAAVSFLADVFSKKYRTDLLSFLIGGNWPQDCLSDADVFEINSFIQKLPAY